MARGRERRRAPRRALTLGFLHEAEGEANEGVWPRLFAELRAAGRATALTAGGLRLWVAAERLPEILALSPEAVTDSGSRRSTPRYRATLCAPTRRAPTRGAPTAAAEAVRAALEAGGALFFDDLLARLRLLPSQLEAAPSELAGQGLAACDGFAGLRALSAPRGSGGADGCRGPLVLDRDITRLGRLPGAETGTGGGVDIESGAEFAARVY
ncbi:MAG: hypothetical protein ACT4QB_10590 [Gammaproteobacteria bacterium]